MSNRPFSTPGSCTPVIHDSGELVHDCRTERGGTKTASAPPSAPLEAVNEDGETMDLFEDETGSVVVDDALDFLILKPPF